MTDHSASTIRVVARWDHNEDEWYFTAADADEENAPEDGQFVFDAPADIWAARVQALATWNDTHARLVVEAGLLKDYPALDLPCITFAGDESDATEWARCHDCGRHRRYHSALPDVSDGPAFPRASLTAWAGPGEEVDRG